MASRGLLTVMTTFTSAADLKFLHHWRRACLRNFKFTALVKFTNRTSSQYGASAGALHA
jgi:hypothetical protein